MYPIKIAVTPINFLAKLLTMMYNIVQSIQEYPTFANDKENTQYRHQN